MAVSTEKLLQQHLPAITEAWRKLERLLGEFERELHLGRVHDNEVRIAPVKIYPQEMVGETLVGLKAPMAPDAGRRLAAAAYGHLEHDGDHDPTKRKAPSSVKCYGVIGVPKRFIDRATDINIAKKGLKEKLKPLAGKQMRVRVKQPDGEMTREKRDLRTVAMRRLQSSHINLLAAYRQIPVLTEQVRAIRFDHVTTHKTVAHTAKELIERLSRGTLSPLAAADLVRLKAIPADESLSHPSHNSYSRVRARVLLASRCHEKRRGRPSQGKRLMTAELPILYPVHPAWPEPEITLPSFREEEGPERRLEDEPFVKSLNYYRRKPQYRGEKRRGPKKKGD